MGIYSNNVNLAADTFFELHLPTFHFEHWQEGKLIEILSIEASSCQEGVSLLSDKYKKGVFRLCNVTTTGS